KLMVLLVVILLGYLFGKFALLIQVEEKLLRKFMVYPLRRPVINIKRDPKLLKTRLDLGMVLVNNCLWCCPFLLRLDGNGRTMLIRTTHIDHIPCIQTQKTNVNIGRDVGTRQVTNMQWTVGIRQC